LVISPRDPAALAEALRSVRSDPEGARIRSQAGKRYVEARFGVERLVADLSALYQQD
jgi:glycosyltransferase involved in cell wall biosynthesis